MSTPCQFRGSPIGFSGSGISLISLISTKFEEGLNREGVLIQFSEDNDIKPGHRDTKLEVMQTKIKIKSELPSRE